jgi:thiamine biosynthesis protein ThiS
MIIYVNGKKTEIQEDTDLSSFLLSTNIVPEHVVVELNLSIIERALYKTQLLKENDSLEIVHFVGGG